jgi:hypothetical protein
VNEEQHRSQSGRRRFSDEEFKRNAVELLEAGGALGSATGPGVGYLGLFFRQVEAQVSLHGGPDSYSRSELCQALGVSRSGL